jgi:Ca2+/H+ antiporter
MELRLAFDPPRWALRFYLRRFPLVFGLSLIPAAQRYASQTWPMPQAMDLALELVTLAARVLLVVIAFRIAVPRIEFAELLRRARSFADRHWPSLVCQGGLLLLLTFLFKVAPENLVPLWTDVGPGYTAVLLAVKNVTVIAFTMLWVVGVLRQFAEHAPVSAHPRGN